MKKWFKPKLAKSFLKFLAVPAFFATIIASTIYGVPNKINTSNLVSNQSKIITRANSTDATDQPTIDDVVNGDVSSLSQPITTADGNYVLPTLTTSGVPGLIKANSFVAELYGMNFSSYNGYHVRQIIQNYNDQNQYFVLLVNDAASVTASVTTSSYSFVINNPGHVLAVRDFGSGFAVTADYQLDAPILDQSMLAYYAEMYFQRPLSPTQEQSYNKVINNPYNSTTGIPGDWDWLMKDPWVTLSPRALNISTRNNRANMLTYYTIGSPTSLKKFNETWQDYTQNVATFLYLNSLNNMVFVSNKVNNSGADAIYLFGGNKAINLWFYTFMVNQNSSTTAPIIEQATAYANYRIWFPPVGDNLSVLDSSDIDTQKAYNFNLNINNTSWGGTSSWNNNPYKNASFFGYYVAGAKYVDKPNPQIELALTIPNFALFQNNTPVIFTTNVMFDSGNKYAQPPQSRILNIYGEIPINTAIQTTNYRNQQAAAYAQNSSSWSSDNSWDPRYAGGETSNYNFVNVANREGGSLEFDVDANANDGYLSKAYNKLVAYVPEIAGNDNVALKYSRGRMTAVALSENGQPSYTTELALYQSNTKMDDLTNISFSGGTWFLSYRAKDAQKSTIYSFSYESKSSSSFFSQTNLELNANLDVLNILPLNSNFIYVLAKDTVNHQVTPLLYRLAKGNTGNYQQNTSFNNLITDSQVAKLDGVPAYATNGIQNADQKAIWGQVSFQNIDYLQGAGFLSNPATVLANDPAALNTLVQYTPGWEGQNYIVSASADENNQLHLQVSIEYFNGLYYSPQQLSAQNALTQVYGGFSALPSWVLPVAIAVPILFLAILVALGLGLGIPMAKTRKLQDKGFSNTFKKVDTLTSAVGSVYKKIISQTAVVKKKPQMLKASDNSAKKPNSVKAAKPITPSSTIKPAAINKPAALGSSPSKLNNAPTKPVGSPAKPPLVKKPISNPSSSQNKN